MQIHQLSAGINGYQQPKMKSLEMEDGDPIKIPGPCLGDWMGVAAPSLLYLTRRVAMTGRVAGTSAEIWRPDSR